MFLFVVGWRSRPDRLHCCVLTIKFLQCAEHHISLRVSLVGPLLKIFGAGANDWVVASLAVDGINAITVCEPTVVAFPMLESVSNNCFGIFGHNS